MDTTKKMMRLGSAVTLAAMFAVLVLAGGARAELGDCGQPATSRPDPSAVDCQFVLKAAVGIKSCSPSCICDTTGDGTTSSNDALLCLTSVVSDTPLDKCSCVVFPGGPAIQESCVVCHGDGRLFDVAVMHPGLRTLPQIQASIDSVTVKVNDAMQTAKLTVHFTATDSKGGYIPGLGAATSS